MYLVWQIADVIDGFGADFAIGTLPPACLGRTMIDISMIFPRTLYRCNANVQMPTVLYKPPLMPDERAAAADSAMDPALPGVSEPSHHYNNNNNNNNNFIIVAFV